MAERLVADGVLLTTLSPLPTAKVQVRQPGLVDIDNASTTLEQLEHLLGVQHPGYEASLRVASILDLLKHTIAHI